MSTVQQTIAEQVITLNADAAKRLPPPVLAAFGAEQAALDAAGIPAGVLVPGDTLSDAELLDVHGAATTLTAALDGAPAVVVFYRGAWCPFCNLTLRTYQQQLAGPLAERGVRLLAISPQKPDGSLSMTEANELSYTVLSDPGSRIAAQLGILSAPTDGTREAQAALGLDVAAGNLDGTDALPMPTVVLLDADRVIRWIDVHPNYTTRTEPDRILEQVAGL